MNPGLSISIAAFCFFFAAVLFGICYIQLRKKHWPLIEGVVIAQRYTRSHSSPNEDAGQNRLDISNKRITTVHDVKIIVAAKHYELSFENLPVATAVGDKLFIHVHSLLPQLFYCLHQRTESYSVMYFIKIVLMGSFAFACVALGYFFAKLA
jgi:hypothetical protein